jgi:hypothetical protein
MGLAVDQPRTQRGAGGAVERDDAAAVSLTVADDEFTGALRQAHVAGVEVGELADPQAGAQQQFHDRPVAGRAEALALALHGAQLLGRERPRRRGVDLDARHARRRQRARVQQRRRRGERDVDRRGRQAAIDEAPAPVGEHRAAVVLAVGREEGFEFVAGVEVGDEVVDQRR